MNATDRSCQSNARHRNTVVGELCRHLNDYHHAGGTAETLRFLRTETVTLMSDESTGVTLNKAFHVFAKIDWGITVTGSLTIRPPTVCCASTSNSHEVAISVVGMSSTLIGDVTAVLPGTADNVTPVILKSKGVGGIGAAVELCFAMMYL
ncbi:MAG: hypothetical protein WCI02_01550 [Planctomycetota bacterium]